MTVLYLSCIKTWAIALLKMHKADTSRRCIIYMASVSLTPYYALSEVLLEQRLEWLKRPMRDLLVLALEDWCLFVWYVGCGSVTLTGFASCMSISSGKEDSFSCFETGSELLLPSCSVASCSLPGVTCSWCWCTSYHACIHPWSEGADGPLLGILETVRRIAGP